MASQDKITIKGSCHCGFIKYEAQAKLDRSRGGIAATRCNCTYCQKTNATNFSLDGPGDFKLLAPASKSETGRYVGATKTAGRHFCPKCGTHVWSEGSYEHEGQVHNFFSLNLASVDQPQDAIDLSDISLKYWDGLNNNWEAGLKDKPFPGGLP